MTEARGGDRMRALMGAKIVFNFGSVSHDCLIRNMSEAGAKIVVAPDVGLPDVFDLVVPSRQTTYRARLRWRSLDEIGVAFSPSDSEPVTQRIALLEVENKVLRRQLAEAQRNIVALQGPRLD